MNRLGIALHWKLELPVSVSAGAYSGLHALSKYNVDIREQRLETAQVNEFPDCEIAGL